MNYRDAMSPTTSTLHFPLRHGNFMLSRDPFFTNEVGNTKIHYWNKNRVVIFDKSIITARNTVILSTHIVSTLENIPLFLTILVIVSLKSISKDLIVMCSLETSRPIQFNFYNLAYITLKFSMSSLWQ